MISSKNQQLYTKLHQQKPSYGIGGGRWRYEINKLARAHNVTTILDYGCGKGNTRKYLTNYEVVGYDPALPEFNKQPDPADMVISLDVLEHVEPQHLDSVLNHILGLMNTIGFFVISTRRAVNLLPNGENCHAIVKPGKWWLRKLQKYFEVSCHKIGKDYVCVTVTPRVLLL